MARYKSKLTGKMFKVISDENGYVKLIEESQAHSVTFPRKTGFAYKTNYFEDNFEFYDWG